MDARRRDELADLSAAAWRDDVASRATAEQDRAALGRLVDEDHDEFETALYEHASDPVTLLVDRARRRAAGNHRRHVRRRGTRERDA